MAKIDNPKAIERQRETVITPPSIVTPLPSNLTKRILRQWDDLEPLVTLRTTGRNAQAIKKATPILASDPNARERTLARVAKMAGRLELNDQLENLRAAVYEPATPEEISIIVGVLLDGLSSARSLGVGVQDAIAYTLEEADVDRDPDEYPPYQGFSARVLTSAIRKLLRTCTFAPSPAEVLAAANEARERYHNALAATNKVLHLRLNAEDIVDETDPNPPEIDGGPDLPF